MDDPFLTDMHARIRQAFLLGLARQPLAVPPALEPLVGRLPSERDPALVLLALIGQRQRFVLPEVPAPDAVSETGRRMHDDPRPILPPLARRALSRLMMSVEKAYAGPLLSIAVRRIAESGSRVHSFDLPSLAPHIKADAENLGLAERAYLALTAPDGEDGGANKALFFDRITSDNWTTFPRTNRRAFLADVRRQDPTAGRALIEGVWKTEQAPMRAALLEALAVGLGPDDKPFLDSLSADRAESVRQAGAQLLMRIPSTEDYKQRLAMAAACFKSPPKGLIAGLMSGIGLSGGAGLLFAMPEGSVKDNKNWTEMQAARERLFAGLRIAELADAAGATVDEIVAALPEGEQHVFMLLLDAAVADGDLPMARRILGQRLLSSKTLPAHLLMQLAEKARVTLTEADSERLLATPAWADTVKSFREATTPAQIKDDGRIIFTATLMPRATIPTFVQSLAELSPASTRAAKDFADLMLALPDAGQSVST